MTHHIFTLSVGALTCALIALSVANATDQVTPPDSTLNQPIAAETLENAQETQSGEDGPADL